MSPNRPAGSSRSTVTAPRDDQTTVVDEDTDGPGGTDDLRGRDGSSGPAPSSGAGRGMRGRVLDRRYRIGAPIARGGMATVHEALDLRLDRRVAVKVMHPGLADAVPGLRDDGGDGGDGFAARLAREARSAARLSHPNVVSVYDQGEDDGVVYLAMELVEGHTLRDVAGDAPLAPARTLALLEPVVAALAAAHRAGIVHRDVKPENVLIADDGRVKVADFGLARAVGADTQHTATQGVLIGTVSYLAPELVVDGRADARVDVYAVGVMLYELLTGAKPHEGETPIQVAYRHVHHDVPAPSAAVPGIPAYVDALVARATARDREQRPADAGVLLHQLRRVAHALADGLRVEPELTRDLALLPRPTDADRAEAAHETAPRAGDTAPEAWADDDLAALGITPATAARPAPAVPRPVAPAAPRETPRTTPGGGHDVPRPPGGDDGAGRRRRGPALLVGALVLALAVGGGAFWFGWARYSPAPGVTGLSQVAAEQELTGAGLEVAYAEPVYDSDTEEGQVVSASPEGGARVAGGDTVTLTLSRGPLLVPAVRDLDEDAAQDALLERQLEFGESIERFSESRPEGTVLASRPGPGTELTPGDTVDLVVSKGRRPIPVGDWVGRPADRAESVLTGRGLEVERTESFSADVPEGDVISQSSAAQTLNRGDTVTLEVSQGPVLVEIPAVQAFGVSSARTALLEAGFEVEVVRESTFFNLGIVTRTDPESGTMAPEGSTITLFTT